MRMKQHLLYSLALLSLGVTACKDDVVFDQTTYDNRVKESFVVENVDPNHQWATMTTATADVTVNGDYGETYRVGLYLGHPALQQETTLLHMGEVPSGGTLHCTISHPIANNVVYVGIFDKAGRRFYMSAPIENGAVKAVYGADQTPKQAMRRVTEDETTQYSKTAEDYLNNIVPNSWWTIQTVNLSDMASYTALTDDIIANETSNKNHTLSDMSWYYNPAAYPGHGDGKHYRVAAGTEIKEVFHINAAVNTMNDCVIYIEGKVHMNGNTLNGVTLVVANGGEIVVDGTTHITNCGRFIILPGGKMTGADGVLWDNSNGSVCYNGGLIEFKGVLDLNGTNFYNAGTVNVDVLTGTAGDTKFTNFGKITARTNSYAASTYNQTWVNACYVHFTESAGLGTSVLLSGSRFDIDGDCTPMAGTCEMHNQSELKVGGMLKLNGNTFNGPTTAGEYAIVKCSKLYATWADAISVNGRVYFDFDPNEIYGMWSDENRNYRKNMNDNDYQYSAAAGIINHKIRYWVNEENALNDITIPEGCGDTGGFNANGNNGNGQLPDAQQQAFRYCFEDNFPSVGDYDFNDVVLTLTPTLDDKTLKLTVSLDAVGATKTIGAAMRLVGVKSSDLQSSTVNSAFASPEGQGLGEYQNIRTNETFLAENQAPNNTGDMVIVLFKDAHWAINPNKASNGGVWRAFYNTVDRNVPSNKAYPTPTVATFTLVFKDAAKAQGMLAENLYDVFIVEPYNGAYWEVHTVQNGFKTAEVLTDPKPVSSSGKTYAEAYGSNMPWAIMTPGNFQYPIEWQKIGLRNRSTQAIEGAYATEGHSFAEWAENATKATDWYNYPDNTLVFK